MVNMRRSDKLELSLVQGHAIKDAVGARKPTGLEIEEPQKLGLFI